jgi:hypothetical protein
MDYLELDDAATQAFGELGGDIDLQYVPSRPCGSTYTSAMSPKRPRRRVEATYLLRLGAPLSTPRDVSNALGLSRVPELENGIAEIGEAHFCRLSQSTVDSLDAWAENQYPKQKFTKIRVGLAHKDTAELPLLGRDPTLPHHRPISVRLTERPLPEFPVRYFFYGTLADTARLERILSVPASELPSLEPAVLLDGRTRTWAGKYKALVDEPGGVVDGFAFSCSSVDWEDALRAYEGDAYEVVAARLVVDGREIVGRTFRFAGFDDELTN